MPGWAIWRDGSVPWPAGGAARRFGCALLAALTILLAGCSPPPSHVATTPTAGPVGWDAFAGRRVGALISLAAPVLECIRRHDTTHPAFHGCIDWHSSVHATYALLAVSRLTGDPQYRRAALTASGDPGALAAEREAVRSGALDDELPYGFAWLLVLDAEAGRDGLDTFHALGTVVRDRLVAYLRAESTAPGLVTDVAERAYASPVWADFALARWAGRYQDGATGALTRQVAVRMSGTGVAASLCTPEAFAADVEFLSPCHLLYLLSAETEVPDQVLARRLDVIVATPVTPEPLPDAHAAGLNFSRAWGLYAAWRTYHRPELRNTWVRLVSAQLDRTDEWRTGYDRYAHWVAQFGIFAIAATFDG
jgi:hypothetical protein